MNIGWKRCNISTGLNFAGKLSKCLWYIDPHHSKFASRGIHVPSKFSCFQGYNDYKKKDPRLSSSELNICMYVGELSEILMQPWFSAARFKEPRGDVERNL